MTPLRRRNLLSLLEDEQSDHSVQMRNMLTREVGAWSRAFVATPVRSSTQSSAPHNPLDHDESQDRSLSLINRSVEDGKC